MQSISAPRKSQIFLGLSTPKFHPVNNVILVEFLAYHEWFTGASGIPSMIKNHWSYFSYDFLNSHATGVERRRSDHQWFLANIKAQNNIIILGVISSLHFYQKVQNLNKCKERRLCI
ncbi:hypothetical protein COV18_03100 [Candidatus Woesearchaeota archaeon CG10_big_fil_rev_8_21_14_0_10_37_12]|nr:MAG: hypothetical protein COV18_03100 [Candidatus Woesearchaeota archaeon CG10_big_fil_rev_8_21_14_0_10_37_12]